MAKQLKLTIELVPSTAWGQNLRKLLKPFMWQKLRREVLNRSDGTCMICKSTGTLDCHEVWKYDDTHHIQKLDGFLTLCKDCHEVKHIGLAELQKGKARHDELVQHFMKINNCTSIEFIRHYKTAMEKFRKRSRYEWELDLNQRTNRR